MTKQTGLMILMGSLLIAACSQNKEVNTRAVKDNEQVVSQNEKERKKAKESMEITVENSQSDTRLEARRPYVNNQHNQMMLVKHSPAVTSHSGDMQPQQYIAQSLSPIYQPTVGQAKENYKDIDSNEIKLVDQQPVSTFSIDVDTASYANVRRLLNQGNLPVQGAVRIEELINYFSYDYSTEQYQNNRLDSVNYSEKNQDAFSLYTEIGPSPYNKDKQLLHIGIQGKSIEPVERASANLVFLIDVSGSMNQANKIGLLKNALKMLAQQLNKTDKVAIVVYAGAAGTVLKPTNGDNTQAIVDALSVLSAGGSTNGGAGIEAAYALARQSFVKGGINRVVLATDGDFNVGTTDQKSLKQLIEQQKKSGIALSILGFGTGNYNDALMQELAQNGDGNAYYIDTLNEARKVLVDELSSTLMIIAKDVKIQLEFNPQLVSEYRLIGYETRALKRQDFNNDKVDAGDIGTGHTVTALYEISLVGSSNQTMDPLRYNVSKGSNALEVSTEELAFLRVRYKKPELSKSELIEKVIKAADIQSSIQTTSHNFQFAAAVAGFGQLLRGGEHLSILSTDKIIELASKGKGEDQQGYRSEFINLVKLANAISPKEIDSKAIIAKQ